MVNAHWAEAKTNSNDLYEANINIFVSNRMGIFADIAIALNEMKVQLLQVFAGPVGEENDENATISIKISCKNIEHYYSIVSKIRTINGVHDISRGML